MQNQKYNSSSESLGTFPTSMPVLLSSLSFLVSLSIPSVSPPSLLSFLLIPSFIHPIFSSLLFFYSFHLSSLYPVLASLFMTRGYRLTHGSSNTYTDDQTSLAG